MTVTFTLTNNTAHVTLTTIIGFLDPAGMTNYPSSIAPGTSGTFVGHEFGDFITFSLSNSAYPSRTYPALRVRWVQNPVGVNAGPQWQWQSTPVPTDVYADDTNSVTTNTVYLNDVSGSKAKRSPAEINQRDIQVKRSAEAAAEEIKAKRAEGLNLRFNRH
ncbi:hypothetical protein TWF694_001748 [Orbilia ellipsospora]|uniref:Reelin domain-containing protein n=1 Tax=Orbilia ellipsospora TaxID=2528407 RepID=A0AAV9X3S2_9PEZI